MGKLIFGPSEAAMWQQLVIEAARSRTVSLHQDLESYLVFLLMRFTHPSELFTHILGVDFLAGLQSAGQLRQAKLREVGDQCLLLSGLFPKRVQRLRLELSYFVKLGQMAYAHACVKSRTQTGELFAALGTAFVSLMDVLQGLRALEQGQLVMSALDAASLWYETEDPHALIMWERDHDSHLVLSDIVKRPR